MKTALVTGASSGIGKSTAKRLLSDGLKVYVAARRMEKMQDLVELGAIAIQFDITKQDEIDELWKEIETQDGGIDVLVNNAGYAIYGAVEDTSIEDAKRQFEVNIFGLAYLTKKVIPQMRKKGAGKIINISSAGGKLYTPLGAWYHATKHALEGWSDCLRLELKQFGIKVVIIEPGIIKTEFSDVLHNPFLKRSGSGYYKKMTEAMARLTAKQYDENGRGSSPDVIANVISKAVRKKNPRTRYIKGSMGRLGIYSRRIIPDWLFDKILLSQVK